MSNQAVIFDFDGTLVDTMPALKEAAVELISSMYEVLTDTAEAAYMDTVGRSFRDQLKEIFPYDDEMNETVAHLFQQRHHEIYKSARPTECAADALRLAADLGVTTICTSSSYELVLGAIDSVFPEYWGRVLGRETGRKDKQVTRAAARGARIFIGDTPYDAECAERAGVKFVAVEGTFSRATWAAAGRRSAPDVLDAVYLALDIVQ